MQTSSDNGVRAPGALRLALELRAPWEFGASLAALPILMSAPRGDGHPVLVFPGLAASDLSTGPLRRYLKDRNYAAHRWQLGRNFGPRPGVLAGCERLVAQAARTLRPQGQPDRLEPRRHLRARDRQASCRQGAQRHHARHAVRRPPARDQRLAALRVRQRRAGRRPPRLGRDQAGAAGADHLHLQPHRRHRRLAMQRAGGRRPRPRTSRSRPATSGSASTRRCSMRSPIAWRSPKAQWQPFDRSGLRQLVYRDPAAADCFPNSRLV